MSGSGVSTGFEMRRPGAVLDHLLMQAADAIAAGVREKEGKYGVYEAGQSACEHGQREAGGPGEVLGIGFSDLLQMVVQSIE